MLYEDSFLDNLGHVGFLWCYLLEIFMALYSTFRSIIHFKKIIVKVYKVYVEIYSCECPIVPASFVRLYLLLVLPILLCQRSVGYIYGGLFLYSVPLLYLSVL